MSSCNRTIGYPHSKACIEAGMLFFHVGITSGKQLSNAKIGHRKHNIGCSKKFEAFL